jgi:DNA polymerase
MDVINTLGQDSKEAKYQALTRQLKLCQKCEGLNVKGVTEGSPGFGNLNSKIMIVGQSLCRKCMESQIPFTGGSGRLLDQAFNIANMKKSDVFITNVVHCHTPDNRKSLPHEIANCSPFLLEEMQIINPKVIIPLGQDAIISILGMDAWPTSVGKRVISSSHIVYPMYHPSYIMKCGRKAISEYSSALARILVSETNS